VRHRGGRQKEIREKKKKKKATWVGLNLGGIRKGRTGDAVDGKRGEH